MSPRRKCRATGLQDEWRQPLRSRPGWREGSPRRPLPRRQWQGVPVGPAPMGTCVAPGPRGFTGERARQLYSAPLPAHNKQQPRSHNTGLPLLPAFIILHISTMTGLKGLLMGNVLRISIFPPAYNGGIKLLCFESPNKSSPGCF